jgi:hypothetical protein
MMSCAELAAKLEAAAFKARNYLDVPTEIVMVSVAAQAKAVLGTYEYGWPSLKPATIARKATGDSPLLETGAMRDSIDQAAALAAGGAEGVVFSTDKVAVYQELGTSRGIPPRSFLYQSLLRCDAEASAAFGKFAVKILTFG